MFSIQRYWAVVTKEFLELKRDRLFSIMTLTAPLILYFLLAYGLPLDVKNVDMGVADRDKTALSRNLLNRFQNTAGLFRIKKVSDQFDELKREMGKGKIRLILVIPENFSRDIKKGDPVDLQVYVDGTYTSVASLIGNYAQAVIADFQSEVLGQFFVKKGMALNGDTMPINLYVSSWYNPSFRSEDFMIPGVIAIVIMFFPPVLGAICLTKEKETGSILNIYCSCVKKSEYLLGKMTPYIIISYIDLIIFLLLTVSLFEVPFRGSLLFLLFFSVFYVAIAVGLGMLIAILVSTQVAAIIITFVATVLPSFFYTGFLAPVSNMGQSVEQASYFLPATYSMDMLRKIMVKGVGFSHISFDALALIIYCVVLYAVSIRLFQKRIG